MFVTPFSVDIGGSMAKVAYLQKGFVEKSGGDEIINIPSEIILEDNQNLRLKNGEIINFLEFPSSYFPLFLKFVCKHKLLDKQDGKHLQEIYGTGGGIVKHESLIEKELDGCKVKNVDEMLSLVRGINFVIESNTLRDASLFRFRKRKKEYIEPSSIKLDDLFPYLFVNIGSGISIIQISGRDKFKRVTGSCIGGATFLGLSKLICNVSDYDDIIKLIHEGDNKNVDLLVGDIYGFNVSKFSGLSADIVASSFGKLATNSEKKKEEYKNSDLIHSLIYMIGVNIAQIVCLTADVHKTYNIIFSGGFMRKNQPIWNYLVFAVKYWSNLLKIDTQVMFCKHHKFMGCLGSMIAEKWEDFQDEELKKKYPMKEESIKKDDVEIKIEEEKIEEKKEEVEEKKEEVTVETYKTSEEIEILEEVPNEE